ncbi:MAG TPA: hypothetical protein VGX48_20415 [Pyrinomonadaceae bacterium]|jgi:hypothetical protein|nr:hypothetical protein [Pyrinomonadaceae bacterium]
MGERAVDCYIDVWRDANFGGESLRIQGPAEFPDLNSLEGGWGDEIGSLRVGPNAFVMAYRGRDFGEELQTFGPNDEIADLNDFKFDDDIESIKVIDSLKIFERVPYNVGPAPPPPAPEPPAADPRRPRGRNRKGRRR